jgi:glutathione S-transferase
MMVMYRDVPLVCANYDCTEHDGIFDRSAWYNVKGLFKDRNPLANLPYIEDGELVVTQSSACMQYLGRKLGLLGHSEIELVQCEQLLCEYMDLRNKVVGFAYQSETPPLLWLQQVVSKGSSLEKLHIWLQRKYPTIDASTSTVTLFFVGDDATAADFAIWEMLDQITAMGQCFEAELPALVGLPLLAAFHKAFKALPGNQRYLTSKLAALPVNNLSARVFGATPGGGVHVIGAPTPWHGSSGTY